MFTPEVTTRSSLQRVDASAMPAALVSSAALPWLLASRLEFEATRMHWLAAAMVALLLLTAGAVLLRRPVLGGILAQLGIGGVLALAAPRALVSPLITLALLVLSATSVGVVRRSTRVLRGLGAGHKIATTRGAASVALSTWLVTTLAGPNGVVDHVAVSATFSVPTLLMLMHTVRARSRQRAFLVALALGCQAAVAIWGLSHGSPWVVVSSGVVMAIGALLLPSAEASGDFNVWVESMLGHPERLFVGTFAALCALGTLLLSLPIATPDGASLAVLDALFTAVSAVCVTGLAVLDTPTAFSFTGQVVILVLIRLGGLGIMTFSTAAVWMFGGRMSLKHESAVASLLSDRHRGQLYGSARRVVLFTFATELVGAVLLTLAFWLSGEAAAAALWRGVFTSISAFCNAGFALQTDSLIGFQTNPFVLHVVASLIVAGSLSPVAVLALPTLLRRKPVPVPLQVKLGLAASCVLIGLGFLTNLAFEWNHALGHLAWHHRLHNAWFQSITLRTAGFNSIDFAHLQPATLTVMVVWMFIGGSPGGTAGGIKTTTAAILYLAVRSAIAGRWGATAFGRRVAERSLRKTMVVLTLAGSTVLLALVAVQLTQEMPIEVAVFEVVSALGTVGLSIGGTGRLDGVGKLIVSVCMFVGRVGGLSLLMFLSQRKLQGNDGLLEQEVDVG